MGYPNLGGSRTGETKIMANGFRATIIKYNKARDIYVKFDTGEIVHTEYAKFKKGTLRKKPKKIIADYIGMETVNSKGFKMKLIESKSCSECVVLFEDGLKKVTSFDSFMKGQVAHCDGSNNIISEEEKKIARVMSNGMTAKIKQYNNRNNILIVFEDGTEKKTSWKAFKEHKVSNGLEFYRNCIFHEFSCKGAFRNNEKAFYKCQCQKCGFTGILTPQQMMAHQCQ